MCGLNGMVFLNGVERSESIMAKVRFIFDELMVESQDRGHHATGLASFRRNGSYDFHKAPESAVEMTTGNKEYRAVINNIHPENTSAIIAHTRWYTKGKPENNKNNHPFDVGNVVGTHNGSVKNDDELFKKFKYNRVGEVDSEIIFQLINDFNTKKITYNNLKKALEDTKLRGVFALAFIHKNSPNLLHLIKQDKPLDIAYWVEAGVIIYNSDDTYIKNAFAKLERLDNYFSGIGGAQTVEYYDVKENAYFTIDANAKTLNEAISDTQKIFIESSDVKTKTSSWNYKSKTTSTRGSNLSSNYTNVTATDSRGVVLEGEIDVVTGEVIIWANDDKVKDETVTDVAGADDGSGLNEDEPETCVECTFDLSEEDKEASFNASNPKGERYCKDCHTDFMKSMFTQEELDEDKVAN